MIVLRSATLGAHSTTSVLLSRVYHHGRARARGRGRNAACRVDRTVVRVEKDTYDTSLEQANVTEVLGAYILPFFSAFTVLTFVA